VSPEDEDDADLGAVARDVLKRIESALVSEGNERLKWAVALDHIGHLLLLNDDNETSSRFGRLACAFRDLELGRADPLFVPKKIDTRPPDATVVWAVRAEVAAAAESLIDHFEITRTEVAEEIAELFPDLQHIAKPGASLPDSIESWRNEFRKGRVKSSTHSNYLARLNWLSLPRVPNPDEWRRRIHIVLECAAEDARKLALTG